MSIDRKEVADRLSKKGATRPCHRCGENSFTILEGFSNVHIQKDFSAGLLIGGPSVPVVHIVCNNCGAVTPHALGALGLLPDQEATDGK